MTGSTVAREDGALVVELTKAAFKALEREFREAIDCAISDLGKGEDDRMRKRLNASADVLCAVKRAQVGWSLEDPREEDPVKAVKFSAAAVALMREQRDAAAGYIAEQDASGEADYEHMGRECFLLHVLDRVLGEAEAA
jgi:hypothetical protein